MAAKAQASTQAPHKLQESPMTAKASTMEMAPNGQALTHSSQPAHFSGNTRMFSTAQTS
jgi:hypothetical protein